MEKYKRDIFIAGGGALFGMLFMGFYLTPALRTFKRYEHTIDDILNFLTESVANGTLDGNEEFVHELSERLTWSSVVITEEL